MLLFFSLSVLMNVVILAGFPFAIYFAFHKLRHKRGLGEVAKRAGLRRGEVRYLGYSLAIALATVIAVLLWSPPVEMFTRAGSAQQQFLGLGFSGQSVAMALLYGIIKTGFSEELLFRGLLAGSLARRLSLFWANIVQALIFLLPHLIVVAIMPEIWWFLFIVLAMSLVKGWIRIESGSIVGPWLIHASANVTMCLSIAIRSAA